MIRYLNGRDPLDILGGNAYGLNVRRAPLTQPIRPLEAVQPKPNVREDSGASLQTALGSLATAAEALRKKMVRARAEGSGGRLEQVPGSSSVTYTRTQATREANQTASAQRTSATLGLDLGSAQSRVEGTEKINTASTSYQKTHLTSFTGGTVTAQLKGVYAGTGALAQSTSLALIFNNDAYLSEDTDAFLRFELRDQTGEVVFDFADWVRAGQDIHLGEDIGLSISFSQGNTVHYASTEFGVSNSIPTSVDLTAAFNHADPNFRPRFEDDAQVVAGSFKVNGTEIGVHADDSIQSVLERITQLTGLQATVVDQQVSIRSEGASSESIVLSDDSSGFLAAVKLEGALAVSGQQAEDVRALQHTGIFSGVVAGSFWVNGVEVSIDPTTDSVQSVVDRVNQSGAGVTASYDLDTDRLIFNPTGSVLDLRQDTSGFLAAAGVAEGIEATQVNLDGAFNVSGVAGARLESGVTVGVGSFTLNGVQIDVQADDTIRSVLSRITQSAADVVATYDEVSEKVSLTRKTGGPFAIQLGADSSGFLAAMKLDETAASALGGFQQISAPVRTSTVLTDPASATSLVMDQLQQVNTVLRRIESGTTVDPQLKAAVRAALANLQLIDGVRALDAQLNLDAARLTQVLHDQPEEALDALSGRNGLAASLNEAVASAEQAANSERGEQQLTELDARTQKLVPGVREQAEVLVQGRLLSILVSMPLVEPPAPKPADAAEAARAKKAYQQSNTRELSPESAPALPESKPKTTPLPRSAPATGPDSAND